MFTATWLVVLILVLLMVAGIMQSISKTNISDEEFERESGRPSLLRTGLQELQGFLEPEKKAALEVVREEKRKTDQAIPGEPPH